MSSTQLTDSSTIMAKESVLSTTIDGETVVLEPDRGQYYGLNDVGTYVWKLLEEPHTIGEICEKVTETYDVEYQRCKDDVTKMFLQMDEKGLINIEEI